MRSRATAAVLLAAATAAVHAGSLGGGFISFDDAHFVYENPYVRAGLTPASLRWALTAHLTFDAWPYLDYWQPLTVLSRMADVELFGLDPRGHKAVNLALHALNAALLFLVLHGMTGAFWRSAFVAALFGVHPLRVESVAWVSERKDVLAGLFWMLTLAAHHAWVKRPGGGRRARVIAVFALGLMAKPLLITLPFILLLLDFWPLRRTGPADWRSTLPRLLLEKWPLLALSAASAAAAVWAQRRAGTLIPLAAEPLAGRIGAGMVDYVRYAWRFVWPLPLALPHPFSPDWPLPVLAGATVSIGLVTAFAWAQADRRPWLPVGWLWFLAALVPVIGLVQPGKIPLTDRYTYLPHIGLAIVAAWGIPDLLPSGRRRPRLLAAGAVLALGAASAATIAQARHWKDSVTVFEHAVRVTSANSVAHFNLGNALVRRGRVDEAVAQYQRALAIDPAYAAAHNTLGSVLASLGRLDEAAAHFREAVRLDLRGADAYNNLGVLLARRGEAAEARRLYEEAVRRRPRHPDALLNLGRLDAAEGRLDAALSRFDAALAMNPALEPAHFARANALAAAGRFAEAEAGYRAAIRLRPDDADAHNNLGRALALQGRAAEARSAYAEALRLSPGHALARENLAELERAVPSPERR